jgi:hypothetical protein
MRILFAVLLLASASRAAGSGFEDHHLSTVNGDQPGSSFGAAVASAGDVNGDGFPDLIVGAPDYGGAAGARAGKAYLFLGSANGYAGSARWTAEGELLGARFGHAVGTAGDLNRDGFDDVVVGSPEYDPVNPDHVRFPGRMYVYMGSAQGLSTTPALILEGQPYDLGFVLGIGYAFANGDFNGDGFPDVVGAQYAKYRGDSQVIYGAPHTPSDADVGHVPSNYDWYSGFAVAAADVNADGYDDLFFTHRKPNADVQPPVSTVVYLGSPTGLPAPPPFGERAAPSLELEGWNLAANIGDFDGDGYDDMVAALGDVEEGDVISHAFFRGSPSGPVEEPERSPVLRGPGRVTPLGDLNGDGFPDVITSDGGTFYLYLGAPTGFASISDGMGSRSAVFAAAGDVNHDGFDDFFAGDPTAGRVDLYRGAADWSFTVRADLSVQVDFSDNTFWMSVRNQGPDTARARVRSLLPGGVGVGGWGCYSPFGGAAAACIELEPVRVGSIDSLITIQPDGEIIHFRSAIPAVMPFVNTVSVVLPPWVEDPDLSNNQVSVAVTPPEEALFSDGFESGDLGAWSVRSSRGLRVWPAAALEGTFGLRVDAPLSGAAMVIDEHPLSETTYHARFRFDAGGFGTPAPGRQMQATLFEGRAGTGRTLFDVRLERRGRRLFLVGRAMADDVGAFSLPPIPLTDGPHVLDVGWRRATGVAARDGLFAMQLDGAEAGGLWSLDNDAPGGLESVGLGLDLRAFQRPASARRSVLFDSFASWHLP